MAAYAIDLATGSYSVSWNGTSVGLLEGQPSIVYRAGGIDHTAHLFGANIIDIVDSGIESMYVLMTLKEWNAQTRSIIWPWGTIGVAGPAFRVASDYRMFPLVFTAESGTPAATLGPVTRTLPLTGLALRQNTTLPQGGDHRNIPVVMHVLPQPQAGTNYPQYWIDT